MTKRIQGLPRQGEPNEPVCIDLEIFEQEDGKLHRPTGHFACASIYYPKTDECYLVESAPELRKAVGLIRRSDWVMHNATFDLFHMARWSKLPRGKRIHDLMLVEIGLYGGYYDDFSLDGLSRRYLSKRLKKEVRDKFAHSSVLTEELRTYSFNDGIATGKIYEKQLEVIDTNDEELTWYWDIDEPTVWAVLDFAPIKVDVEGWSRMASGFKARATTLRNKLGFNPGSHVQAKAAIEEAMGKEIGGTNAKKILQPMFDKMDPDDAGYEMLRDVLDYRMYSKAVNTYGETWLEQHVEKGGLVYPSWFVTGARTGRTACSNPNVQQIPSRRMPQYREKFISMHKNGKIIVIDVAQQEPRILAWFSRDPELLRAFENGEDIHQYVADACFVDRKTGKNVNLGMSYGMSPYGLARDTGRSKDEAKVIIDAYFRRFRYVEGYINTYRQRAVRRGYVRTASGRKVYINPYYWNWKNIAINAPIQGTAAEQTKLALVLLRNYARAEDLPFRMTMQVHDEMVIDSPPDEVDWWVEAGSRAWKEAGEIIIPGIPIEVDAYVGDTWRELETD